jgi:hypothetical protein
MPSYMWNANPAKWTATASGEDSCVALQQYILDKSNYVYWSTPKLQSKILVGDLAYIWRTQFKNLPAGIIAYGVVEEVPKKLTNVSNFNHPARIPAEGWSESSAPSPWKTGIKIAQTFWQRPLHPSFRPAQGTLRTLSADEDKLVEAALKTAAK